MFYSHVIKKKKNEYPDESIFFNRVVHAHSLPFDQNGTILFDIHLKSDDDFFFFFCS